LKASGLTGEQLIRQLIENSDTFKLRTKFSQAKYLRKKLQKYSVTFEVKRPTALELCEAYSQTAPTKILNLRSDSLGLLLQMANVNAESRVLLIDKTKGLLAGALIEKNVKEIMHMELTGQALKL
jgi:tRNA (adenine58-N1)-methyltransferase non-catalytic subunit